MKAPALKPILFIGAIAILGAAALTDLVSFHSQDPARFVCYLLLASFAAALKVRMPGIDTSMSVNFLFTLLSIAELSRQEAVVIACAGALVQCMWLARRPRAVQVVFNLTEVAIAAGLAYGVYHAAFWGGMRSSPLALLAAAAIVFFVANTFPVAAVIALTERKPLKATWSDCYFWSFAYYLAGSLVASALTLLNGRFGWHITLLCLPGVYLVYHSYRLYVDRLDGEKRHADGMASLHLRTIEALALAIDAKDHATHDHLRRVQVYAVELGKELGLSGPDLDALRAAALLHDIGKLAIPEHIISKPGKLTPEEFEKMKIHPVVGAEILERVRFPYPVVPIVRSHHEKWNGKGYPDGLQGEEIPIGARILSAVDCLDALASDRQYRRALPLDEAMAVVLSESGHSYDPRVVEILQRRYRELEHLAEKQPPPPQQPGAAKSAKAQTPAPPAPGAQPAGARKAGPATERVEFLMSIAAARQEVQNLFELSQDLGKSLSLNETLSVLAGRLQRMIPHDAIAVYILRNGKLTPEYVGGDDARLFSSLEIPMGEGLSGWVAKNRKPIVNGNPSVEAGYLNDASKYSALRSALAVPLEGVLETVGVMALYRAEKDSFTQDHLRVLLALVSKVSLSIENALKFRKAESSATTDFLTGLPNARSLFLHVDAELSRCRRAHANLAVLVCDLDGFKQVNDRFGHLQGNKVLQAVGAQLRASCRQYDYVARMGGDEFVVALPATSPDLVRAAAQRLNQFVIGIGREMFGEEVISLSAGEAFFPDDGANAESLLAEADRRMYIEKQRRKAGAGDGPASLLATVQGWEIPAAAATR